MNGTRHIEQDDLALFAMQLLPPTSPPRSLSISRAAGSAVANLLLFRATWPSTRILSICTLLLRWRVSGC